MASIDGSGDPKTQSLTLSFDDEAHLIVNSGAGPQYIRVLWSEFGIFDKDPCQLPREVQFQLIREMLRAGVIPGQRSTKEADIPMIDLSRDPLDLRPATDELLRGIESRLARNEKMIIVISEVHANVLQSLLKQFLCQRLLDRQIPFGVALELPCNLPYQAALHEFTKRRWLPRVFYRKSIAQMKASIEAALAESPWTHNLLYHTIAATHFHFAPVTTHVFHRFLLEHRIPLSLVDVPRHHPSYFTISELRTAGFRVGREMLGDEKARLRYIDPTGIAFRNAFMAQRIRAFWTGLEQPPIIIVSLGVNHFFMDQAEGKQIVKFYDAHTFFDFV